MWSLVAFLSAVFGSALSGGGLFHGHSNQFANQRLPQVATNRGSYGCRFQTGQWGQCSASCGVGVETRYNHIQTPGRPDCPPREEKRPCLNLPPCPQFLPPTTRGYGQPARPSYGKVVPPKPLSYCERLEDGFHPNPDNACDHEYIVCSNGLTSRLSCPGSLYFDLDTQGCQSHAYITACGGHPAPPVTTTLPPAPTTTQAPLLDCSTLDNGLYPHPQQKCAEVYFVCDSGITSLMQCPPSLYYDEDSQSCLGWNKVFACSGKQFIEPEPPIPDHKEPVPVNFDCTLLEGGEYPDPEKQCSERFYHCTNKIAYEKWCPLNTYFDAEYGVCNTYANIPQCSGKARPVTPGPEGPKIVVMLINLEAPLHLGYGLNDEQLAKLGQALAQAFKASPSLIHKVEVPTPTSIRLTADYAILATVSKLAKGYHQLAIYWNGQQIPVTTVSVVDVIEAQRLPARPVEVYDFDCSDRYNGNYAKDSCAYQYWACSGGETEKMFCPEGLFYDAEQDLCEDKDHVIGCGGQPRTTTVPPQLAPTPPPKFDCELKENGYYTLEACSQTFYHCSNGEANELTCPGKTYWDEAEESCNSKQLVAACGGNGYGRPKGGYGQKAVVPKQQAPRGGYAPKVIPQRFVPQPSGRYAPPQAPQRFPANPQPIHRQHSSPARLNIPRIQAQRAPAFDRYGGNQ